LSALVFQKSLDIPFCEDRILMPAQQVLESYGAPNKAIYRLAVGFLSQFCRVSRSFREDSDVMEFSIRRGFVQFPDCLSELAKLAGCRIGERILQVDDIRGLCRITQFADKPHIPCACHFVEQPLLSQFPVALKVSDEPFEWASVTGFQLLGFSAEIFHLYV
jgi:hypothetical protein